MTNLRRLWGAAAGFLLLASLTPLLSGCGYALVGRASGLPEDVQTVYMEPFENRTTRSQVEQILGIAVANELVLRQRLELVSSADEADSVLTGEITNIRLRPVTFDATGFAEEYEISIRAAMTLSRTDEDETVLWFNPEYDYRENYELNFDEADSGALFDQEIQAVEDISEEFAKSLVSDLLEAF